MVDVTWHGHACVGLRTARGAVVMDPFSPQIGLQPLHVAADIVVTSHPNPTWHSYLPAVADPWLVLDGLVLAHDPVTALGLRFSALTVGEDLDRGGDANAMVMVQAGGLRLLHFGDLGHAIEPREAGWCQSADVWFALAGGSPTIPVDLLAAAWRTLRPRLLIPIHYRTPSVDAFAPVADFLAQVPDATVRHRAASTVTLAPATLPTEPEIWVLEPACEPAA